MVHRKRHLPLRPIPTCPIILRRRKRTEDSPRPKRRALHRFSWLLVCRPSVRSGSPPMPTDCDSALAATDPELYARCPNIKRVLAGGNPVGNPVVNVAGLMAKLAMSH